MKKNLTLKLTRVIFYLIASLSLAVTPSCTKEKKSYRIAVSQPSDDEWRRQMNDEINREMLFHEDAKVEIRTAGDNSKKQIEDIDYFIREGFDIIIIAPNEAEALTPAVRKAYQSGIPVIVFDRNINDTTYTSRIDLDNTSIGREAGKYALEASRKKAGKIVELTGLSGSTPAEERHSGFISALSEANENLLVGSFAADWTAEPAYTITDSLLAVDKDIKVIYAHNDVMAIAAAKAARKAHRNDIVVIGTDGAPELGIKAVEDSLIDVTFTYPTVGEEVIRLAMGILHNEPYNRINKMEAVSYIDNDNARMHLQLNDVMRRKTARIEELNSKYMVVNSRHNTQKTILYIALGAALLLVAGIIVLLYYIRKSTRFQKELAGKNDLLLEQQHKQEELYSRLEEATRSKLAFFTNVSHDLRTPLALIADPVEKIAKEPYLPPNDRALMKMVVKNVKILRRMIDQILDFRRYENGATSLNLKEAPVLNLITEWCANFNDYAKRHKINFSTIISSPNPDKRETMAIDVEKMERVVFNLLSNAFKYTDANGSISVDALFESDTFVLKVRDTGTGMAPEEMSKIFERFYQVDSPRPQGSGIGLSLSKAFVEMMNGTIAVESEPGKGSCFSVAIPVFHVDEVWNDSTARFDLDIIDSVSSTSYDSVSSASYDNTLLEVTESESECRIDKPLMLVIDDNEDIRTLIRLMAAGKYNVIDAANGKEGLRLAMKYIPDVIVCDIMMPDMDGLEVTRKLKEERITSHIPVLVLTACRLDEQRVKSYQSGADGFLSKPFTQVMLKSRCDALIKNRRRIYDLLLEEGADSSALNRKLKPNEKDSRLALDNEFYRDFIGQVKDLYSKEDLTMAEIAEKFSVGPTQLTRKIKALTGKTPVEIIREYRLNEARKRLLTTNDTISEIAFSTGFSSSQYFSRCFREAFNISPSELRASIK